MGERPEATGATATTNGGEAALPAEGHTVWRGLPAGLDDWSVSVDYDHQDRALHVTVWSPEGGQGCAVPLDRTVGLRDLLIEAHGLPGMTDVQAVIGSQRENLRQAVWEAINEGYSAGQRFADAHHALKAAEENFKQETRAITGLMDTAREIAITAFPLPAVEGAEEVEGSDG